MYSVSVRHLTKTFRTDRGTVTATDDLSLTFPAGEITAVVGESGCGKTTLLRLIAGLETADEGSSPKQQETAPPPAKPPSFFRNHDFFRGFPLPTI